MAEIYFYTFTSVAVVSLISLIGALLVTISYKVVKSAVFILVSLAAGALFGDALIHLIPEALEESPNHLFTSILILIGILVFFSLEKFLHWHHSHSEDVGSGDEVTKENHVHPTGWMILISDGIHNLVDGLIIAGSFLVSIPVGLATTLAVILHEIPQEIGDFGVLLHSGFTRSKALFLNFLSAILAILGAMIGLVLSEWSDRLPFFIIPIAAGGFLYIAGSDLIPELQKTLDFRKSIIQFLGIVLGVALMILLVFLE